MGGNNGIYDLAGTFGNRVLESVTQQNFSVNLLSNAATCLFSHKVVFLVVAILYCLTMNVKALIIRLTRRNHFARAVILHFIVYQASVLTIFNTIYHTCHHAPAT